VPGRLRPTPLHPALRVILVLIGLATGVGRGRLNA
jgi:hypothetical protein